MGGGKKQYKHQYKYQHKYQGNGNKMQGNGNPIGTGQGKRQGGEEKVKEICLEMGKVKVIKVAMV